MFAEHPRPDEVMGDDKAHDDAARSVPIDEDLVWCGVVCGRLHGALRFRAPSYRRAETPQPQLDPTHPISPGLLPGGVLRRAASSLHGAFTHSTDEGHEKSRPRKMSRMGLRRGSLSGRRSPKRLDAAPPASTAAAAAQNMSAATSLTADEGPSEPSERISSAARNSDVDVVLPYRNKTA